MKEYPKSEIRNPKEIRISKSESPAVLQTLRDYESRNVTYLDPDGTWPIVWDRAQGVHVWDLEGRKYLDLTAAFGVAAAGHANPRVVEAGQAQLARLPHAMGDVHPHALKARLARELSRLTFERWAGGMTGKTIFCNSGFEAVEAALKTATLATGKRGIIAFVGGYHGLGYGALNATHREHFRAPFRAQLGEFGHFVPFPATVRDLDKTALAMRTALGREPIGAVLVEPVQARGGINLPPPAFLPMLRRICQEQRALLIFDEIYTGFGRTGKWFACEHSHTVPDLVCLGKALTGGFPLSACVGRADLMDAAWPASNGEAIHTSTFLGNPVGCAMALAQIQEITRRDLPARSAASGKLLLAALKAMGPRIGTLQLQARGLGLMAGLELRDGGQPATSAALKAMKLMLQRGFILLPEGEHGNVISFTPPLTISGTELKRTVTILEKVLGDITDPMA
jgi:4-aminobutyrate aminotransferase-like enzyme